ncbi:4-hydroxy-tetrahydrodipicolinate synthase [Streptomyces violarus]
MPPRLRRPRGRSATAGTRRVVPHPSIPGAARHAAPGPAPRLTAGGQRRGFRRTRQPLTTRPHSGPPPPTAAAGPHARPQASPAPRAGGAARAAPAGHAAPGDEQHARVHSAAAHRSARSGTAVARAAPVPQPDTDAASPPHAPAAQPPDPARRRRPQPPGRRLSRGRDIRRPARSSDILVGCAVASYSALPWTVGHGAPPGGTPGPRALPRPPQPQRLTHTGRTINWTTRPRATDMTALLGRALCAMITPFTPPAHWTSTAPNATPPPGRPGLRRPRPFRHDRASPRPRRTPRSSPDRSRSRGRRRPARRVAGVGTPDTAHTLTLAREAEQAGADAVRWSPPTTAAPRRTRSRPTSARPPTRRDLPLVLYDIPSRTGVRVEPDTLLRLAGHPRDRRGQGLLRTTSWPPRRCWPARTWRTTRAATNTTSRRAVGGAGYVSTVANVAPTASAPSSTPSTRATRPRRPASSTATPLIEALMSAASPAPSRRRPPPRPGPPRGPGPPAPTPRARQDDRRTPVAPQGPDHDLTKRKSPSSTDSRAGPTPVEPPTQFHTYPSPNSSTCSSTSSAGSSTCPTLTLTSPTRWPLCEPVLVSSACAAPAGSRTPPAPCRPGHADRAARHGPPPLVPHAPVLVSSVRLLIGHGVRPFIGPCAHPFICKNHPEVTPGNSYGARPESR